MAISASSEEGIGSGEEDIVVNGSVISRVCHSVTERVCCNTCDGVKAPIFACLPLELVVSRKRHNHPCTSNDTLMNSGKSSIVNVHTPSSSTALLHSSKMEFLWLAPSSLIVLVTTDTLPSLFDKLSRKSDTEIHGQRVGPGWLKYEWNGSVWDLNDGTHLASFRTANLTRPRQTQIFPSFNGGKVKTLILRPSI
jgi:hypothetical protein